MTWLHFYLWCFFLGLGFSLLSFFTGGAHHLHLPLRLRLPWHPFAGHAAAATHGAGGLAGPGHGMPALNVLTLMTFLTWFGGMGYLLGRSGRFWPALVLGAAGLTGLAGAALVFAFLARVLLAHERPLEAADSVMTGLLARVSVPIRAGGTGEVIYSQGGTRHSCGARSETGGPVARGAEVVVTRYEDGIAYVRLWEELAREHGLEDGGEADR